MTAAYEPLIPAEETLSDEKKGKALRVIGWFSVGIAVAAIGIYLGNEIRGRYKFKRRTPYDFYANAEYQPGDYGVGV